jgi:hypothetical protein
VRIISFSLFGPSPIHQRGAVENVRLCHQLYPGWVCRFYLGDSIPNELAEELADYGDVDLVRMDGAPEDWWSTFWRFRALTDDTDAVMFRDCDSRPDPREQAAVAEWLDSDKYFHVMRDHPEHGMPILAGLWGVKRAGTERIRGLLPKHRGPVERYLADQFWLADKVYPIARQSLMVHASPESPRFEADGFDDLRDFPVARTPGRFAGQGFNGDNTLRIPADALRV